MPAETLSLQPSTKAKLEADEARPYHPDIHAQLKLDTRNILLVFRFFNAIVISTFFQPDEYYQSLEPAWEKAFGVNSGAWITWEWHHQLRSSLHPVLFSGFYYVAGIIMDKIALFPQFQAIIYTVMPKIIQAVFAACGDLYTWKLAEKVYGEGSNTAWVALLMTIFSPWQFFVSTRTLSNSLETALTIMALYYWPWSLAGDIASDSSYSKQPKEQKSLLRVFDSHRVVNELRICLVLAGVACILRPTNLLIWLAIVTITVTRVGLCGQTRATFSDLLVATREVIICGSLVLGMSATSDYLFYGFWTFPPYQWLHFNITQSLAVFYGVNRWDYYATEGLPLLLTTYLPFALLALWSGSSPSPSAAIPPFVNNVRFLMTFITITTISTLTLISHKEVRFIYPLLPLLHVLTAPHIYAFFAKIPTTTALTPKTRQPNFRLSLARKPLLYTLLVINLLIAGYTTQIHQRGVLSVLSYLRQDYEKLHLSNRGQLSPNTSAFNSDTYPSTHDFSEGGANEMFVGFLMPCHSTPWRSHLVHPTLRAWALTCEPPLHIPAGTPERAAYRDEADRFYDNPVNFVKKEIGGKDRAWPRYIVGFEGIEESLKEYYQEMMPGMKVRRRWQGFNSHWHDDDRRRGDVIVWEFVDPSKKA